MTTAPPDRRAPGDSAFHLLRVLLQAHTAVWQQQLPEVTKPQYAVLRALRAHGELDQTTLAAAAAVDTSTLVLLLDRLARRGLLTRSPDPGDRRRRLLRLTTEGARFTDRLTERAHAVNEHFLHRLDTAHRGRLLEDLRRMLTASSPAEPPSTERGGRRHGPGRRQASGVSAPFAG
jgi:MarR family transcriptional regulator, temperature-dependent positive regulator of motility